jgi:hypothetical protein
MSFDCSRLEEALREEDPGLLALAREHAAACEACRAELEQWQSFTTALSTTAKELRREWESPELWARIEEALPLRPASGETKRRVFADWRLFASVAAVLLVTVSSLWLVLRPAPRRPTASTGRPFLTEQALREVQESEAAYVRSIDKLATLAAPAMEAEPSPLLASYREKLALLDAAIADLRENREHNLLNARLNTELLSLYQEKQKTLQEVLQYASHSD